MALLLSDDGQVARFQRDDGQIVEVASQFAQPYLPEPPPDVGQTSYIDQGALPPEVAPPVAPMPAPVEDVAAPPPAPVDPPPMEMEPEPVEAPSILPQNIARTPTAAAGQVLGGMQEQADASFRASQAESRGLEQVAGAVTDADATLQKIEWGRQGEAERIASEEKRLLEEKRVLAEKHANYKIDPNRDVSTDRQVLAWIGVALAGLGQAMQGKTDNPALDQLMANMDRRIKLQMAERDHLGQAIAYKGDEITDWRKAGESRLGEYGTRMGAELMRLDKRVQAIGKTAESAVVRENANILSAQLKQQASQHLSGAARQEAIEAEQRRARQAAVAAARAAAVQRAQAAQAALQESRARFQVEKDVVWDGTKYVPDPNAAKAPGAAIELATKEVGLKQAEQNLGKDERERLIEFRGKPIGLAKTKEEGVAAKAHLATYNTYQREITELANMLSEPDGSPKKFYMGKGYETVPDAERDAVLAKARKVLYLEAKVNDPTSAVREAEIEFGKEVVPWLNGWTSNVNPRAKAAELLHSADTKMDDVLDATLEGGLKQNAGPSAAWKAARAASERSREQGQKAQTPKQLVEFLGTPIDAGETPEGRKGIVDQKRDRILQIAKERPWVLENVDTATLVQGLSPEEAKKIIAAMGQVQRAIHTAKNSGSAPLYYAGRAKDLESTEAWATDPGGP